MVVGRPTTMCTIQEFASRIVAALHDGSLTRDSVTTRDELLAMYADDRLNRSPHLTYVLVKLAYDTKYGGKFVECFRMSRETLAMLQEANPAICVGGKRSKPWAKFNDVCFEEVDVTVDFDELSDYMPGEVRIALERINAEKELAAEAASKRQRKEDT